MTSEATVVVRALQASDHADWAVLYRGYRAFYKETPDDAIVDAVWEWLIDPEHPLTAVVAVLGGRVVGLAHVRPYPEPSNATVGLFLDDLFTAPDARGRGVAHALLEELAAIAERDGYAVVRWITAHDNARARRVYDAVAEATPWVTYDMKPGKPTHAEAIEADLVSEGA
ncbi:MAG TPA: GNAT family N-acetyltransferase [Humibacter sp.]|nr:GNAT family N-acetyltransferase [Humibacter sp.]